MAGIEFYTSGTTMKETVQGFLTDDSGNKSITRFVYSVVFLLFISVWVIISIKEGKLLPIPDGFVSLFGVLTAGTAAHKYVEKGGKITHKE